MDAGADERVVVLMSGLPATGKTTLARRLHGWLGGDLIRQCDVYARLGIDLRAWVRTTAGFTRDVAAYERVRDEAYAAMREELRSALARGASVVVVDAVHGETAKRRPIYDICRAHDARPIVVWCRCDDADEIRRRVDARSGRGDPEHEASDLSVDRHLRSLWQPPSGDRLPGGATVPVVVYDSMRETWRGLEAAPALAGLVPIAAGRPPAS